MKFFKLILAYMVRSRVHIVNTKVWRVNDYCITLVAAHAVTRPDIVFTQYR